MWPASAKYLAALRPANPVDDQKHLLQSPAKQVLKIFHCEVVPANRTVSIEMELTSSSNGNSKRPFRSGSFSNPC